MKYKNKAELAAVEKLLSPLMFPKRWTKDRVDVDRVALLRLLLKLARAKKK